MDENKHEVAAENNHELVDNKQDVAHVQTEEEKETGRREWAALRKLIESVPNINYCEARRLVKSIIGPTGRIWRYNNVITIGIQEGPTKYLFGEGGSYKQALIQSAMVIAQERAKRLAPKEVQLLEGTSEEKVAVGSGKE